MTRMNPELEAQVLDLYVQHQLGIHSISRRLGIGFATVHRVVKVHNVLRPRRDMKDVGDRISAAKAGVPVALYQAEKAKGRKWCAGCRRFQKLSEFGRNSSRGDGLETRCRKAKNEYDRRWDEAHRPCAEGRLRPGCTVRWGRQRHRHCQEPIRLVDGEIVACDLPMVLDVDRCATCEALAVLQARVTKLEAVLRQRGIITRLPTLAQAFEEAV